MWVRNKSKNKVVKMNSMQNVKNATRMDKNNIKNMSVNTISNNNVNAILNDNLSYNTEPFDSKYTVKINKIKDDYIDFLQKEFEDNTKKSVKLDTNNKELLKKYYRNYMIKYLIQTQSHSIYQ